jgi:hypothetical protein
MQDPKADRDVAKEASQNTTTRVFYDADGQRWNVYEKPFDAFDRRSGSSLIFASEGAMRRVRNYPANWTELTDEELAALSWSQ